MFGRRKLRPIDPSLQMHRQHAIHTRAMPKRMDKAQTKFSKGQSPLLSVRLGFRVQNMQANVSELGYAKSKLLARQIKFHMLYHSDGSLIVGLANAIGSDLYRNEQRQQLGEEEPDADGTVKNNIYLCDCCLHADNCVC